VTPYVRFYAGIFNELGPPPSSDDELQKTAQSKSSVSQTQPSAVIRVLCHVVCEISKPQQIPLPNKAKNHRLSLLYLYQISHRTVKKNR